MGEISILDIEWNAWYLMVLLGGLCRGLSCIGVCCDGLVFVVVAAVVVVGFYYRLHCCCK